MLKFQIFLARLHREFDDEVLHANSIREALAAKCRNFLRASFIAPPVYSAQKSGLSARGTRSIHDKPDPCVFSAQTPSGQGESPKICR
jgi:hypothetical protein